MSGLIHREIAACATNGFAFEVRTNELEAIAKSIPLANHRMNSHRAVWEIEVQLDMFAQASLNRQHG
jgi:hypothetical protein